MGSAWNLISIWTVFLPTLIRCKQMTPNTSINNTCVTTQLLTFVFTLSSMSRMYLMHKPGYWEKEVLSWQSCLFLWWSSHLWLCSQKEINPKILCFFITIRDMDIYPEFVLLRSIMLWLFLNVKIVLWFSSWLQEVFNPLHLWYWLLLWVIYVNIRARPTAVSHVGKSCFANVPYLPAWPCLPSG